MKTLLIRYVLFLFSGFLLFSVFSCSEDADLGDADQHGDDDDDENEEIEIDASGECSLVLPDCSGDSPDGNIPVCCAPDETQSVFVLEVFALLNEHREDNGVDPLVLDEALIATIQGHCLHMAEHSFFDHSAPESEISSPWTRAEMCGTSAGGENIAMGQQNPEAVMGSWKSSDGHNKNMLNPDFTRVGIGYVDGYWGQIFGW